MSDFYIGLLVGIFAFCFVGFLFVLATEENEKVAIWYLTNIFGLISFGSSYLYSAIKKSIRKRKIKSIIKIKATNKVVWCDYKYFDDFSWTNKYEQIRRYAVKDEWGKLEKIDKITLQDALRNCDHCKHDKGCNHSGNDCRCEFGKEGNLDGFKNFEKR